jgi:hypothetical protein
MLALGFTAASGASSERNASWQIDGGMMLIHQAKSY